MKKIKLAVAMTALIVSANASAMPATIPAQWYGQMSHRLGIMALNPGFCSAVSESWICSAEW